ncbi:hypothetical protein ABVF61_17960 [Roseibium sp. HPY-6]|uniref:hypothetical protein n=1 Tax=Roseibium sp. HPY-6 TaxID=3229852 RepID=UPI00338D78BB
MQKKDKRTGGLFGTGFGNIILCYAFILTFFLSPFALYFAISFSEPAENRFFAHYYYIRTTIAVMVIGGCMGSLMILLGADVSSFLILAGLAVVALAGMLTFLRCLKGILCAFKGEPPRTYTSYLL